MYDSNFDRTFFLREPENVENGGKIVIGVTVVAIVVAAAFVGYFVYRERHPQHQVIVQPVAGSEPPGWGPGDDDEEEDRV
ncbi:unnamed protein product [Caenorhabditis brenneri]